MEPLIWRGVPSQPMAETILFVYLTTGGDLLSKSVKQNSSSRRGIWAPVSTKIFKGLLANRTEM